VKIQVALRHNTGMILIKFGIVLQFAVFPLLSAKDS